MTETEVRRSAIRALVDRYPVSSQEDLVDLLRTEHAISASQPTVSRDLEVLGIRRVGRSYRLPEIDGLRQRLRAFALEIASSGNLAVIRTPPGGGPTVAAAIDAAAPHGRAGDRAGRRHRAGGGRRGQLGGRRSPTS